MIVDIQGCAKQPFRAMPLLEGIAKELGLRVLDRCEHRFGTLGRKNGETVLLLLAESHMSLHTWPEKCYAAFDLFSCKKVSPKAAGRAIAKLLKAFGTSKFKLKTVERG